MTKKTLNLDMSDIGEKWLPKQKFDQIKLDRVTMFHPISMFETQHNGEASLTMKITLNGPLNNNPNSIN
jgi:hypothetical protein